MNNEPLNKEADTSRHVDTDGANRVGDNNYDPHITPAETAARQKREGNLFKTHPTDAREAGAPTDDQTEGDSVHVADGFTVDKEGLLNNYAIEPEMYYEVPGDAREAEAADKAQRAEELAEVNEDSEGDLTMQEDKRGRGPGIV